VELVKGVSLFYIMYKRNGMMNGYEELSVSLVIDSCLELKNH